MRWRKDTYGIAFQYTSRHRYLCLPRRADPLARYVIDDEFGDLTHKEESFANRVLFWRKDDAASQAPTVAQTAAGAVTIDASTEAARLQALTGNTAGIAIRPRRAGGFKLPGL